MPEIKIQELLEAINKDGIEKGEEQARKIISDAQEKARQILQQAKDESESMIIAARSECDAFVKQGNAALRQALDNACISLKSELNRMIGCVVRKSLSAQMDSSSVSELVKEAMKNNPSKDLVLELSRKAYGFCVASLHDEISKGLVVKVNDSVRDGFRLCEKDGSGYYDFSADELVALVMPYLSDSLAAVLKG